MTNVTERDEMLSVAQVADLLGESPRTVLRRVKSGQIPARRLGTGRTGAYVIQRRDIPRALDPLGRLQDYDCPSV